MTIALRHLRRRLPVKDERGFTLLEVVVTVGILSIVMTIGFAFLTHVMTVSNRAIKDVEAENGARLALRSITEDIRAAEPDTITFTGPTGTCPATATAGTCVSFTIVRDTNSHPGCESAISYGLVNGAVKESRTDYGCANNITLTGKTIIANVMNGSTALFTYFDKQGSPLASGQAAAGSMGVTLILQYQPRAPLLTLTSYASLRNAR